MHFIIQFNIIMHNISLTVDNSDFCCLLLIFANSSDTYQDQQNVSLGLDPNHFTLKEFFKKIILKIVGRRQKHEKFVTQLAINLTNYITHNHCRAQFDLGLQVSNIGKFKDSG